MIASVTKLFEPELKIIAAGMAQDMAQAETEQSIIRLLQNKVVDRIILNSFPKYTQEQINKLKEAL